MLSLLAASAAQVDPRHAVNLTLFHEHSPQYTLGLVNQDTGNARGDAYFVLRGLMLPVECASHVPFARFDCNNPEQNSTDNVISQHLVQFDSRWGPYGSCNMKSPGNYSCECGDGWHHTPCGAAVGRAEVAKRESRYPLGPTAEDWQYWRDNLATKLGGSWFSTVEAGKCSGTGSGTGANGGGCTWQLLASPRTIVAKCLEQRVAQAVASYQPACFEACPQPTNASTACVVRCYMATILGPDGGRRTIDPSEGMPISIVTEAWQAAFADPEAGGCPEASSGGAEPAWPLAWGRRPRRE